MCGICGIIDYRENGKVAAEVISRMRAAMKHRGPDDEGIYVSPSSFVYRPSPEKLCASAPRCCAGLGHRRLSIIDLSPTGHQPMCNEDNSVWIVFNGEIYNYKELKPQLEEKGHIFKSNSDTEAIIHLYESYGIDCVKHLRGMFAFAIWDENKETLFLARDRVGKKPLLYCHNNGRFCFSSEFLSLIESGLIEKEINPRAIDYYLAYGYIPAPLTIYKNVFKLLPAHTLVFKKGDLKTNSYWNLDFSNKIKISEQDAAAEVLRLLEEAVKIRLYSEVPLGAFLSGGVDSSAIVGLMSRLSGNKVKTFSIGFEEEDYSELEYARSVAKEFDTDHNEFIVKPKALEILPLLVERYGEPYADSSCIPTYYVSQQTRQFVTVALNGDGGDEAFAGYERYQAMTAAESYRRLPAPLRGAIGAVSSILPDSTDSKNSLRRLKRFLDNAGLPKTQRYLRWVGISGELNYNSLYSGEFLRQLGSPDTKNLIGAYLESGNKRNLIDSLLLTDTLTYLPNDLLVKVDIASMANSLEARSPFLDHKLMEFAAKLPSSYKIKGLTKKYILKKALNNLVPEANIKRRKMGFGVPVGKWFRGELREFLREALLSGSFEKRGYLKMAMVKDMVERHTSGGKDYSFQLWSLLMLELWHRRFIDS
ncbi:MAG: asparagine synthase (glutamine-hydrolyzing) [Candidatus Omnitrophota bacterium]